MSDQTFKIRTGPRKTDVKDHPYEKAVELYGHVWVIHRRLHDTGYAMSHRDTGLRVPKSSRERAVEAEFNGTEWITEHKEQIEAGAAMVVKS